MFVDDQVVIDGPFNENCIMQFQTQEDRILAFSVVDGNIIETRNFLTVSKMILIHYFVFTLPNLFCDVFYLLHLCVRFMMESTLMPLFSLWKIKRNFFQTRIYQLPSTPLNRKRLSNLQNPQLQI